MAQRAWKVHVYQMNEWEPGCASSLTDCLINLPCATEYRACRQIRGFCTLGARQPQSKGYLVRPVMVLSLLNLFRLFFLVTVL